MSSGVSALEADSGFTLIEFLVTLVIAGILVTAALPSFEYSIRRSRLASQVNEMVLALNLARSEAVKRGRTVSVCKSSNGTVCDNALNWENGWIVFADRNGDGVVDAGPPADEVLRVFSALRPGYSLRGNANVVNRVTFRATGVSAIGMFVLCEQSDRSRARAVLISAAGRIRLGQDANNNGIPEKSDGTDITTCTP